MLVTQEGRLVILDFGLVSEIGGGGGHRAGPVEVVGTPGYMSPEQAAGLPMTQASDWYAVGVMLYEALTARRPFMGYPAEVLEAKQSLDPPVATLVAPGIPEDLANLAMELLRRLPDERPTGRDIMGRLDGTKNPAARICAEPATSSRLATILVGRSKEVAALWDAFRIVERGEPVTVHVRGSSGLGKSTLARHFLNCLASEKREVVILKGRCHELESVPYKALDSLIDALARYVMSLPKEYAARLIPSDVSALAKVFPVLRRVGAIANVRQTKLQIGAHEVRRSAFWALRDLLARIARTQPLVLYIDDLQWGDIDSALFLRDLFEPPLRPPLLLVECFREEDLATSEVLGILRKPSDNPDARVATREVVVGPLDNDAGTELALSLLGRGDEEARAHASAIAGASLGNPFYVGELVQRAADLGGITRGAYAAGALTVENVILERVQRLAPAARELLEVVAVAGVATPLGVVRRASGVESELHEGIMVLRQGHLIRTRGLRNDDPIEPYHDKVRETVARSLSSEVLRKVHNALAFALEETEMADPEALARHFEAAGEAEKAWQYTAQAAERAVSTLAFARAATLYRQALALQPQRDTLELTTKLGDALANAGRGPDAAAAYLEAVQLAEQENRKRVGKLGGSSALLAASPSTTTDVEIVELKRRIAEQFLRSGHLDDGLAAVRVVLAAVHFSLPSTPFRSLLSVLLHRALIHLRGFRYRLVAESEVSVRRLNRIDICFSIGTGFSNTDPIRGADFNARALLLALKAGEPFRLLRALSIETMHAGTGGTRARARVDFLLGLVKKLSEQLGHLPLAKAWWHAANGVSGYLVGRFLAAEDHLTEAEAIFDENSTGVAWELASVRYYLLQDLEGLGRLAKMARLVPKHVGEALDKGDLFCATTLRLGLNSTWLLGDHIAEARRVADEASRGWSRKGFHLQHYFALVSRAQLELYERKGVAAHERMSSHWSELARSLLMRVEAVRVKALHLRARCALAAAQEEQSAQERQRLINQASQDGRRLARELAPHAASLSRLIFAGMAYLSGDIAAAVTHLECAAKGFDGVDLVLHAAVTRRRLGKLIGGDEGRVLVGAADAWMASETIRCPASWTAMIAPGIGEE